MILNAMMTKKLFILLVTCLCTMAAQCQVPAQEEHMKFMGIPIDGSIKQFHKELIKRGFKRNYLDSDDSRDYHGTFSGEEVELKVCFDKKTKTVHRVGVFIPCYSDADIANRKYKSFKYRLEEKYKAYSISQYIKVYDNNGLRLEEDIKNGNLTYLNSTEERLSDEEKETTIYISKPIVKKDSETDTLQFSMVYFESLGNVGAINIKTFKFDNIPDSSKEKKYENGVMIAYIDTKNSSIIEEQNNNDL